MCLSLCIVVLSSLLPVVYPTWSNIQRILDDKKGQHHYNFGQSLSLRGDYLAVGSITSNMGRGHARVYWNSGEHFIEQGRLVDRDGLPDEAFGSSVSIDINATIVVVGAERKEERGAAFLFRRSGERGLSKWRLSQQLEPYLDGDMFENGWWFFGLAHFGRQVVTYDGSVVAVSAEPHRPGQTAVNIPGTTKFVETMEVEDVVERGGTWPNDFLVIFRENVNGVYTQTQWVTAEDNNPRTQFGYDAVMNGELLVVGAKSRIRLENETDGGGFGEGGVGGWVYVFADNGTHYQQFQVIRPPHAYYIGHSLALSDDGEWLMFGNEWFDRDSNNTDIFLENEMHDHLNATESYGEGRPDSVYVYRTNGTGYFEFFQELVAPQNSTKFGYSLDLSEHGILVVGSPGRGWVLNYTDSYDDGSGEAYVYRFNQGGNSWDYDSVFVDTVSQYSQVNESNMFGYHVQADGNVIALNSLGHDWSQEECNQYLSIGGADVWYFTPNPMLAASGVIQCQYTTWVRAVKNTCILSIYDINGDLAGQVVDTTRFTMSMTNSFLPGEGVINFVSTGKYNFSFTPNLPQLTSITVELDGTGLSNSPLVVTVTEPVVNVNSSISCNMTAVAGYAVDCVITLRDENGALAGGQEIVDQNMLTAHVYNIDLPDYKQIQPSPITYTGGPGIYEFQYTALHDGVHATLIKYDDIEIGIPNPYFTSISIPPVSGAASTLECPPIIAPLKNASCIVTLRGGGDNAPAGTVDSISYIVANLTNENSNITLLNKEWLGEGKVRIKFRPEAAGTTTVEATYNGEPIPAVGTMPIPTSKTTRKCSVLPKAQKTVPIFIGHYTERNNRDIFHNEVSYTEVETNVHEICEEIEIGDADFDYCEKPA